MLNLLSSAQWIVDWDFVIFEQCETKKKKKEREAWQLRLKTFPPTGVNKIKQYLF